MPGYQSWKKSLLNWQIERGRDFPTKLLTQKRIQMAEQLDQDELVSFRELLISNTIQLDVVTRLLIEKGIFTNEEFFVKLKQVQMEYKRKNNA